MRPVAVNDRSWWLKSLSECQAELAADEAGLSGVEASLRLSRFGPNRFRDRQGQSLLVRYLTRFKNPPVILLLVASAISVSTGELANFLIITFIVLLSVTLDFVQEYHAGKADRLGHSVSVRATVMRVSSMFDVLTYYVMLVVLKADEALFQTGWFVESLSTQVLVIFIIRTRGNPLRSRPHPLLAVTSLAIVTIAVLLPFTPLGTYFGFVPLPAKFYAILAAMVITYLAMVQVAKKGFYRWSGAPDERRGTRAMARSPR